MKEVTYGQMGEALRSLGFSCRTATLQTKALVYEHPQTGALIILPVVPVNKKMLPHHMAMVKGTLDVFGIADPLNLAAELQKAC